MEWVRFSLAPEPMRNWRDQDHHVHVVPAQPQEWGCMISMGSFRPKFMHAFSGCL